MFAQTLADARHRAGVSVAHLAELSRTSRSAITDYEAGRKFPRVDTAERILDVLGEQYVAVDRDRLLRARIADDVIAPMEQWTPDPALAVRTARDNLAVIVDADANAERLDVSWGQVKTLVGGTTVDGDPLSVWRVQELFDDTIEQLRAAENGIESPLRLIAAATLVQANDSISNVPRRAMDFLVRATELGADPAHVRHLVGAHLAHHGYPWLWVPHTLGDDYRRAIVACRRQGDGTPLVCVMLASLNRAGWR